MIKFVAIFFLNSFPDAELLTFAHCFTRDTFYYINFLKECFFFVFTTFYSENRYHKTARNFENEPAILLEYSSVSMCQLLL